MPNEFGSGQTCHRRFQEWERAGVFKKIYSASQNSSNDNRSETA
ncbi:transposase [Leptospira kirschneri]